MLRGSALTLLCALGATGCTVSPKHTYSGQSTVYVAIPATEWSTEQADDIRTELRTLSASFHIQFAETDEMSANVVVHNEPTRGACLEEQWYGWTFLGAGAVWVRGSCVRTHAWLRMVVGHEIGHWVGMQHLPSPERGMMSPVPTTDVPTSYDMAEFASAVVQPAR